MLADIHTKAFILKPEWDKACRLINIVKGIKDHPGKKDIPGLVVFKNTVWTEAQTDKVCNQPGKSLSVSESETQLVYAQAITDSDPELAVCVPCLGDQDSDMVLEPKKGGQPPNYPDGRPMTKAVWDKMQRDKQRWTSGSQESPDGASWRNWETSDDTWQHDPSSASSSTARSGTLLVRKSGQQDCSPQTVVSKKSVNHRGEVSWTPTLQPSQAIASSSGSPPVIACASSDIRVKDKQVESIRYDQGSSSSSSSSGAASTVDASSAKHESSMGLPSDGSTASPRTGATQPRVAPAKEESTDLILLPSTSVASDLLAAANAAAAAADASDEGNTMLEVDNDAQNTTSDTTSVDPPAASMPAHAPAPVAPAAQPPPLIGVVIKAGPGFRQRPYSSAIRYRVCTNAFLA